MSFDKMRNSVVESWIQRIERWLIPTIAHNKLGRDTGPFADASMTTLGHRVGLGLSVSSQLASLMGGDLSYEYRNGESIFTLTLSTDPAYS